MSERIAKFMARSGVCSRRQAEELIKPERKRAEMWSREG